MAKLELGVVGPVPLYGLPEHYGVEGIVAVTVTHSFEARMRSYELLAGITELEGRQ